MTQASLPNARRVALIVACAFFMQNLDGAIINTSLPQMAASFGVQPLDLSLGITIYMLMVAACVPASAWIADRFGARNVFLLAVIVFSASSLACGLATSLPMFVAARALQGIGGAMMTPVGRMVVLRHASKAELLQATALITWPALIAPVIGPVLGGVITTYVSWRWNFLLNVPLGIVGAWLVYRFVPNLRSDEDVALDVRGFALASTSLVCLLYGLESFGHAHGRASVALALAIAGLCVGALAMRHFQRVKQPLLDLASLRVQTFSMASVGAGNFFRMSINATPFLLPLLFQVGFGLSAIESGWLVLAYFAGNLGMKAVTTPTLQRFGFRSVLVINGLLAGLSLLACALLTRDTALPVTIAVMFIAGLTRSMQFTSLATLTFADIDGPQRNAAATLSTMTQQISMVLGVAVSALVIKMSQAWHGTTGTGLADFRAAFVAVGVLSIISALMFVRLPHDAGADVSGHRPKTSAA
ncbi:MFS transporter [Uliginosibacterium sp. sgz301328]|uniref:MFS transporter n=1 Tax=Uliginosibacterium sp. sgz301328 TaxID=3243764 RepID=UPI00359CCDD2